MPPSTPEAASNTYHGKVPLTRYCAFQSAILRQSVALAVADFDKCSGRRPVTELAQELGMSQPGASKHLRVLREVGLVRDRKAGKQRLYGLDARGLRPVHEWVGGFERFWNESFDRLDTYVQDLKQTRQEE
jgi:DNA-binding transcriptional ArsR family regulator